MKTSTNFFLVVLASILTGEIAAQCREAKWPEDREQAEEKIALYSDALKQGHYRAAAAPLHWMLTNAPGWHIKLYIDAEKIYSNLAKKEKDPVKKEQLVDSLLWVYDERIAQCGEKIKVLNRKAFSAYKYRISQKEKVAKLLSDYSNLLDIAGENITDGNLVAYMTTVQANHILLKNLKDEDILTHYDKLIKIIDKKIKAAESTNKEKKLKKCKKYKGVIEDLLVDMVRVDCEFVKSNLEPKFRANPNDILLSKKICGFMLQGKCTEDPLWLEVAEVIIKTEKDFGLIKNVALKYMQNGNLERAESLFQEGLKIADDPGKRADMLIYLGSLAAKRKQKSRARMYFEQASATSSTEKRGFEKIGDLYYGSFQECSKKENMAQDRLVYIAAYKMYERAGNTKKMAQAKSQFPSKEEIFLFNWKVGGSMRVDCWIGEDVTINTRD